MDFSKWCESIYSDIIKNKKKVVLIAGGSNSGKGHNSERLEEYLKEKGLRPYLISADNYYKGLSRIITEKALINNPELAKIAAGNVWEPLFNLVKKKTESKPFGKKLEDRAGLSAAFVSELNMNSVVAVELVSKIEEEFKRINFDEPFALNLNQLANDINQFYYNPSQPISFPEYSFKTSEASLSPQNTIVPQGEYDTLIVEGLYALRPEVLSKIQKDSGKSFIVTASLDCDLKTMTARKFDRDVRYNRSTFTPEQTITSFFKIILPSYYEYILPTLRSADYSLNSNLTRDELLNRTIITQTKFPVKGGLENKLQETGAKKLGSAIQTDYFLEDVNSPSDVIFRVREENGKLLDVTIKSKTLVEGHLIQAVEVLNLTDISDETFTSINKFLDQVRKCGFSQSLLLGKKRDVYELDGCQFRYDRVLGLGNFVEIVNGSADAIAKLRKSLGLKEKVAEPYFQLMKQKIEELEVEDSAEKDEVEKKFKVEGVAEAELKKFPKEEQEQFYLNLKDPHMAAQLSAIIGRPVNAQKDAEARIRFIDNKEFIVTVKGDGTLKRPEKNMRVEEDTALRLKAQAVSSVKKTRYKIERNGLVAEFDWYRDRDLQMMEIEYDPNKYAEKQIELHAATLFPHATLTDVTEDKAYKNKNMAIPIMKK